MNIILFGPPGIGKSTIIGYLKTLSKRAIDLEDLYPNRIRFQVPNFVDSTYIGAADLNPARKYPNALKVLLVTSQSDYETRRKIRDKSVPGKEQQKPHQLSDWIKNAKYDIHLNTEGKSPLQTAQTLISEAERRGLK